METIEFTEETFGECFHKVTIVLSNGNVRLSTSTIISQPCDVTKTLKCNTKAKAKTSNSYLKAASSPWLLVTKLNKGWNNFKGFIDVPK
jgi:hypothetical protein